MNETLAIELINAVNRLTLVVGMATLEEAKKNNMTYLESVEIDLQGDGNVASTVKDVMDDAEQAIYYLSKERQDVKGRRIVSEVDEGCGF